MTMPVVPREELFINLCVMMVKVVVRQDYPISIIPVVLQGKLFQNCITMALVHGYVIADKKRSHSAPFLLSFRKN